MGSHPRRADRHWPSDAKVYPRRTRPSDSKAQRRLNAKGTQPTIAEMQALLAAAIAGDPTAAGRLIGISESQLNDRLQRLKWRVGARAWRPLIYTLLIQPLQRKVARLEGELAAARRIIEEMAEAESEVAA